MHNKESYSMPSPDLQRKCQELLEKLWINQKTILQNLRRDECPENLSNNLQSAQTDPKPVYARRKLKSIMKQATENSMTQMTTLKLSACENSMPQKMTVKLPMSEQWQLDEIQGGDSGCQERQEKKSRLVQGALDVCSVSTKKTRQANETQASCFQPDEADNCPWKSTEDMGSSHIKSQQIPFTNTASTKRQAKCLEGNNTLVGSNSEKSTLVPTPGTIPATPTTKCRRHIIDKNVQVDSQLYDSEWQDTEKKPQGLNFSYSNDVEKDETMVKAILGKELPETLHSEDSSKWYRKHLGSDGNNRQMNNFIRETTVKPKSLLNSTQPYSSLDKRLQGASFSPSASGDSLFHGQSHERRLLGYDWIAALIDNDQGLVDQSESYFQELREFRRCNRDECCNDFYMEGPFTLKETESPEVGKVLNEHKVLPYSVNERLFTVSASENLEESSSEAKLYTEDEPTQEHPRFVRVSIPRSTLQSPYKVRPHRRRSFDSSDTCSLLDHCLLGWSAVRPSTLPTASSVALTDSAPGANSQHSLTLAEAERAAASFQWPLLPDPKPQVDPLPTWRKHYMDTTLGFPNPHISLSSSVVGGASLRRRTDDLLSSTYSMMYEMQHAREQREQNSGQAMGIPSSS